MCNFCWGSKFFPLLPYFWGLFYCFFFYWDSFFQGLHPILFPNLHKFCSAIFLVCDVIACYKAHVALRFIFFLQYFLCVMSLHAVKHMLHWCLYYFYRCVYSFKAVSAKAYKDKESSINVATLPFILCCRMAEWKTWLVSSFIVCELLLVIEGHLRICVKPVTIGGWQIYEDCDYTNLFYSSQCFFLYSIVSVLSLILFFYQLIPT